MKKKIFTLLTALVLSIGIGWAKMAPDSTGVFKHEHVKVEKKQVDKKVANAPRRATQAICDMPSNWWNNADYADDDGFNTFDRDDVNFQQLSSSQICLCAYVGDEYCRMTFNIPEGLNYVPSGYYSIGDDETSPYTMAYSNDDETVYMFFYWYWWYYAAYSGGVCVVNPQHEQIPQYVYMDYTEGYYWDYHARVTFGEEPAVRSVNINNTEPDANGNYVDVYAEMCYDDNCTQFYEGTTFTITPQLQNGYELLEWTGTNSGDVVKNQDGTYTLVVGNKNYNITPVFASVAEDGVITTLVNDANFGHIEGAVSGIKYDAGTYLNLSAIAEDGYMFVEWEDHDTTNPRKIRVNGNASYKAIFKTAYMINVTSNNPALGSVEINPSQTSYYEGQQISLVANPANSLCDFIKWSDGNTQNPRPITVNETTAAITYAAEFDGVEATEIDIQAAMVDDHGWGWGYCFYYWAKTYGYDIQIIGADNLVYAEGADFGIDEINTSKSYINDHGTRLTFTSFDAKFYTQAGKKVLEAVARTNNGKAYLLKLRGKPQDNDDNSESYNQTYTAFNKTLEHKGDNVWQASSQNGTGATYSTTWCNHFFFKVDPSKGSGIPSGIYQVDDSQTTGTLISTYNSNYQSYGSYYVQSYFYYVPVTGYAEVINTNGTYYMHFEGYTCSGYTYEVTVGTRPITTHDVTFKVEGQEDVVIQVAEGGVPAYPYATPTKESTAQYDYAFTGWTPAITAVGTEDQVYTANFTSTTRKYAIRFENYDHSELATYQVAYGETPEYTEDEPTKPSDEDNYYEFTGWGTIVPVEGPATYTAQYTSHAFFQLVDDQDAGSTWYTETFAPVVGTKVSVKYMRTFAANQWAAFSLPFAYNYLNEANTTFKGQVYYLVSAEYEDGSLILNCMPNTSKIEANKPYILIPTESIENPIFENVKMKAISDATQTIANSIGTGTIEFINTLSRVRMADYAPTQDLEGYKHIIYISSNSLYYTSDSKYMRAFRGMFRLNGMVIKHAPRLRNMETGEEITLTPDANSDENVVEVKKYIEDGNIIIERNGVKYDAQGKQQ